MFDPRTPLRAARVTAFVATADAARSRAFYESILGLRVLTDDGFATAYDCAGIQLRVQKVDAVHPHAFTALGWQVHDLERVIDPANPEVTVGARLRVCILDNVQHAGQAAYVRGLIERRRVYPA